MDEEYLMRMDESPYNTDHFRYAIDHTGPVIQTIELPPAPARTVRYTMPDADYIEILQPIKITDVDGFISSGFIATGVPTRYIRRGQKNIQKYAQSRIMAKQDTINQCKENLAADTRRQAELSTLAAPIMKQPGRNGGIDPTLPLHSPQPGEEPRWHIW